MEQRPPVPPFTEESAKRKIQAAEDAWNSKDPERVALAYTVDSEWRNRDRFINGREKIKEFLREKWANEHEYRLRKSYWAHGPNRIAVRFEYEWHDDEGQWFRSYGNENWEFDANGLMCKRFASINDVSIEESERKLTSNGE
jgi:nuclear transport factor 2 (NTF2) superfamily protein